MKKIFISLITMAFLLVILSVDTTSAYFISEDKVTNNFENANIDVEIEEHLNFIDNWTGLKVDKPVKVKNKSTVPVLVRVSITPSWSSDKNGNEPFMGNISSEVVKLNFKDNNGNSNLVDSVNMTGKWIDGNDGYYYYTAALGVGEVTSELLKSVEATISADIVGEDCVNLYEDKFLQVGVKSEAIQISDKSYEKLWNVTDETIKNLLDKIIEQNKIS